ncbi:hypothetical protein COLO4_11974 [Corchorus olitorius]|uniref:DUF4283 domain-containing protein n=1 Tax=Corchorus olitorius TaxID=93759 RepID=A0A1R3K2K9_9ROSI|nr:hypothetical protein COLO4_11974 [Corchorus olitorius]
MDFLDLEIVDSGDAGNEEWMVVGKVIVDRNLNRSGVLAISRKIWPEKESPSIAEVEVNVYSISFASEEIMNRALEGNTWSIMGHCFNLKKWLANTPVREIDFSSIQFWVKVHNLPMETLTKRKGDKVGQAIGDVQEIKEARGSLRRLEYHDQKKIPSALPLTDLRNCKVKVQDDARVGHMEKARGIGDCALTREKRISQNSENV